MATQATTRHRESQERLRMKGTKLLERLILAGLNELPEGQPMDANQINAARIALAKILPDLRAIEHSGETTTHVTGVDIKIIG